MGGICAAALTTCSGLAGLPPSRPQKKRPLSAQCQSCGCRHLPGRFFLLLLLLFLLLSVLSLLPLTAPSFFDFKLSLSLSPSAHSSLVSANQFVGRAAVNYPRPGRFHCHCFVALVSGCEKPNCRIKINYLLEQYVKDNNNVKSWEPKQESRGQSSVSVILTQYLSHDYDNINTFLNNVVQSLMLLWTAQVTKISEI